jgi:hypothetical protein
MLRVEALPTKAEAIRARKAKRTMLDDKRAKQQAPFGLRPIATWSRGDNITDAVSVRLEPFRSNRHHLPVTSQALQELLVVALQHNAQTT